MAKLKGKAKSAFLKRMAAGRRKAAKLVKSAAPKRRKSQGLKRKSVSSKSMAKKKSKSKSKSRFAVPSIVKKAAAGIGLATIATVVINQVAPQAGPIISPIAAFVGGGPVGLVANFLVSGTGILGNLFGGGGSDSGGTLSV